MLRRWAARTHRETTCWSCRRGAAGRPGQTMCGAYLESCSRVLVRCGEHVGAGTITQQHKRERAVMDADVAPRAPCRIPLRPSQRSSSSAPAGPCCPFPYTSSSTSIASVSRLKLTAACVLAWANWPLQYKHMLTDCSATLFPPPFFRPSSAQRLLDVQHACRGAASGGSCNLAQRSQAHGACRGDRGSCRVAWCWVAGPPSSQESGCSSAGCQTCTLSVTPCSSLTRHVAKQKAIRTRRERFRKGHPHYQ